MMASTSTAQTLRLPTRGVSRSSWSTGKGAPNKLATEIVANVTRNRPAVVKMTQPAHDVEVSPLEELKLKAELDDDFGIVRHGLSYSMAGDEPREIVLPAAAAKTRRLSPEHMLDFESLHGRSRPALTYFFWAEDIGPDGQPRRTSGDMFFAEVRPFEEIFRQGEQPPSGSAENEEQEGQQGNARASDQLAEVQKEIINGTWKADPPRDGCQTHRQARRRRQGAGGIAKRRRSNRRPSSASDCKTQNRRATSNRRPAR